MLNARPPLCDIFAAPVDELTRLLHDAGDPADAARLLPLVYDELRRLAARKLANERPGHKLQPTALVHEACLRLAGGEETGRQHFSGAVTSATKNAVSPPRSRAVYVLGGHGRRRRTRRSLTLGPLGGR